MLFYQVSLWFPFLLKFAFQIQTLEETVINSTEEVRAYQKECTKLRKEYDQCFASYQSNRNRYDEMNFRSTVVLRS
jgi:hypothetical protein